MILLCFIKLVILINGIVNGDFMIRRCIDCGEKYYISGDSVRCSNCASARKQKSVSNAR